VGSHRRLAPSGFVRGAGTARAAFTVVSAAAAVLGAVPAGPAFAEPHGAGARAEVDRL
jgi:hypothetical protein